MLVIIKSLQIFFWPLLFTHLLCYCLKGQIARHLLWRLGFPKAKKAMLTHLFLLLTCSTWKLSFIMAHLRGSRMKPYEDSSTSKSNVCPLDLWFFPLFKKASQSAFVHWASVAVTLNADHSTFPILINDGDCSRPFGLVFLFAIDWCHMPAVSVDSGPASSRPLRKRASNLCHGSISDANTFRKQLNKKVWNFSNYKREQRLKKFENLRILEI